MTHKYDPFINFAGLERLQQELGKIFNIDEFVKDDITNSATSNWKPLTDIQETDEHYVIQIDLPGVDPEQIDIALKSGVLTVSGHRPERDAGEGAFKLTERRTGEFQRRFTLPDLADEDRVDATTNQGVLTISISKKTEDNARKIRVVARRQD
ncbi:MAG: Hsp20/alpha crystallin family protein [Granulosicoccus sp.]|nr:Hsp20/alpha crystallin family protein [Granulosicoccus sp.]